MSKQRQDGWFEKWSIEQVHVMSGLSIDELNAMRATGEGPKVYEVKHGQISYRRSDVEMWLKRRSETKEDDEQ